MRARGFTLLELVIAVTVSLVVVAGAMTLTMATQRSFEVGVNDRAMQETARVALGDITRNLRAAGYGLEPTFVFDFGQATTVMDRIPTADVGQVRFGGYACGSSTCRDSITGPDEIVFYRRDPAWERDVNSVGAGTLTLAPSASGQATVLSPGQILQLMCYGSSNQWLWAYVTVSSAVSNGSTGQTTVALEATPDLPYDFPHQEALLTEQACFASGAASTRAFKIDRYRYFVAAYDTAGAPAGLETAGTKPFLMLDKGLKDADGNAMLSVVAPDVEDLQVAYVFPLADAASGAQVLGATPGVQVAADASGDDTGINLNPAAGAGSTFRIPSFTMPSLDPSRTTHHPANIRAVRVALTVRSERVDPNIPDAIVPASLNRPDRPGERGYRRMVFESTVFTNNLQNRLPVFPQYDTTYAAGCTCVGSHNCTGNCGGG